MRPKDIFNIIKGWRLDRPVVIASLIILLITANIQTQAQVTYSLNANPELKVSGTSTIHDWEMISNSAAGMAKVIFENSELVKINSLKVIMPVRSLKSGKGTMDTNAYKSLRADKFPDIIFELIDVERIGGQQVMAKGNFIISGITREAILEVGYQIEDDKIQFSGERTIKFSEFNIDPPTAVFGTIKTGDDLILSFKLIFSNSTNKITKQ